MKAPELRNLNMKRDYAALCTAVQDLEENRTDDSVKNVANICRSLCRLLAFTNAISYIGTTEALNGLVQKLHYVGQLIEGTKYGPETAGHIAWSVGHLPERLHTELTPKLKELYPYLRETGEEVAEAPHLG